jgi:hypothetical protein
VPKFPYTRITNFPSLAGFELAVYRLRAERVASVARAAIHLRESRKAIRFPLEASVAFSWKDDNGMEQRAKGRSRNISERGVFVLANSCPPVGVKIGLRIVLPGHLDIAPGLRVHVEGRVLRVEELSEEPETCGFAVLSNDVMLGESGDHQELEPQT